MNTMLTEEQQARISAVSVKLLPFWPADPHLWLTQVEAQFTIIKGVTAQRQSLSMLYLHFPYTFPS